MTNVSHIVSFSAVERLHGFLVNFEWLYINSDPKQGLRVRYLFVLIGFDELYQVERKEPFILFVSICVTWATSKQGAMISSLAWLEFVNSML